MSGVGAAAVFGRRLRLGLASMALVALSTLVPMQPAAAAETAGEALLARWVASAEAAGSTVTVATRAGDAARNRVDWRDVRVSETAVPGRGVTIGAARFDGLIERDGSFSAARIELDDVAFIDVDGRIGVGSVVLADAILPDLKAVAAGGDGLAQVLAVLDGLRPLRLGRGEIRDIKLDLPNTATGAQPGDRLLFGFDRISVDGLGDGRLARFGIGRMMASGSDKGAPLRFGFDEARLERVDLGAVAEFLQRDRYPNGRGDGVWREIVGDYAVDGVTIEAAQAGIKLGRYSVSGLALRRGDTALLDLIAAGSAADEATVARGVVGLLDSMRLGRYGFDRLAVVFEAPATEGGAPKRGTASIDTVELRDLSLAGLGAYRIDGVALAVDGIGFGMKEFVIADTAFPSVAAIQAAIAAVAAGDEPAVPSLLPQIGQIRLGGLTVDQPNAGRIGLKRAELRQSGFLSGLPTSVSLEIAGLDLPADLPDPDWRAGLKAYGRDVLSLGARIALSYTVDAATLALDDLSVAVGDDGRIEAGLTVTGVSRELFLAPEKVEDYLGEIGIGGGKLVVTDRGIGDRLMAIAAQRLGASAGDLRRTAIERLPQALALLQDVKRRAAFRDALTRFLAPPATLTLTARPADPVPILQVAATVAVNPWRLFDLFVVDVTAGP